LINKAKENNNILLTTEKDYFRIAKNYKQNISFLKIEVEIENRNQFIDQIKKIYPIINEKDILGGIFMPGDGQADPIGVTNLLAKAAKEEGVKIFEKSPIE